MVPATGIAQAKQMGALSAGEHIKTVYKDRFIAGAETALVDTPR